MFNYPVVHKVVDNSSDEIRSNVVFAIWATDTKFAIRTLRSITLTEEELENVHSVDSSFFETVNPLLNETSVILEHRGKVFALADEKIIDTTKPKYNQKFRYSCNPILIAYNTDCRILPPILLGQSRTRSDLSPYMNAATVRQVIGAMPFVTIHSHGDNMDFEHCSMEFILDRSSDIVCSNIEVTHTVDCTTPTVNGIYNINYVYGVQEVAQSEVNKGDTVEVVVTAWGFPSSVDSTDPADFSQAIINTDVNADGYTAWTVTAISDSYPTERYAVTIRNGVGVVHIPTDRYQVGDVVVIQNDNFRVPPMFEAPSVTII